MQILVILNGTIYDYNKIWRGLLRLNLTRSKPNPRLRFLNVGLGFRVFGGPKLHARASVQVAPSQPKHCGLPFFTACKLLLTCIGVPCVATWPQITNNYA